MFEKISKPLIYFFKELGVMFLNIESWWISKKEYTRIHLRWTGFTILLLATGVLREIQTENDKIANNARNNSDKLLLQKKNNFLEYRYLSKLEEDIQEFKELKKIAINNQSRIKEMKK